MKKLNLIIGKIGALVLVSIFISGCTLMGLDMQKDTDRVPHTLDPHINKTAWEFIKDRANSGDKLFERLMAGIVYSEIDTMEYMKPNRTFIVLNKDAVSKTGTGVWQSFLVSNKAATAWTQYSKEFVKNYLLYCIVDGVYDHYTLPAITSVKVQTLSPKGYWNALPTGITMVGFLANPESSMYLRVSNGPNGNTQDYPIIVNDNGNNVRTASILATNGSIHVVDRFVTPVLPVILY
ncbi:hypothetical protein D3C87_90800 [compost metagenome]